MQRFFGLLAVKIKLLPTNATLTSRPMKPGTVSKLFDMTKIAAQIHSWDFEPQRNGIPGIVWSAFSLRNNCAVGATIGSGFCEKNFTFSRSCIIIYYKGDVHGSRR